MRKSIITDTFTSVDTVDLANCGGVFLEVYAGFLCHNLEYSPYAEFVTEMFEKRSSFKTQAKDLLQTLAENTRL